MQSHNKLIYKSKNRMNYLIKKFKHTNDKILNADTCDKIVLMKRDEYILKIKGLLCHISTYN